MKKQKNTPDTTDHFPEFTAPKFGEKVQSFAVHDAQGRKRIAYVHDEKDGYFYEGKDQKAKKNGR
jgi:hypothetical protein